MLFTQLENSGVIRGNEVVFDVVKKLSANRIFELAEEASELTAVNQVPHATSLFEHSATISLSGGRHPCEGLSCRLQRVSELARFAALYSDHVYIRNPLMHYNIHVEKRKNVNISILRKELFEDLLVMNELRPLVEAGRIVPITPPGTRCPHCLWDQNENSDECTKLRPEFERLQKEFFNGVSVKLGRDGNGYYAELEGDEILLEHDTIVTMDSLPQELILNKGIRTKLRSGNKILLGDNWKNLLGFHKTLATETFENIIFELVLSNVLKTSFLTERRLHLRIFDSLSSNDGLNLRNHTIERYLTALVPFAQDVAISDLLKLREREGNSFQVFRQYLTKVIDEVRTVRGEFSEKDARQLYFDMLAPALAGLNTKVEEAQRDLKRTVMRRSVTWIGAISFGLFTGVLPAEFGALAGALGIVNVLQETGEMLINKADTTKGLKTDPLYFLWKVRNLSS